MTHDRPPPTPPHDATELDACLVSLTSAIWRAGWMPGDVLAAAAHHGGPAIERLAAAVIQREHREQGYGERVSPRWQRQLATVRELVDDPDAVLAERGRSWRSDRFELWSVLAGPPELRRLGPLPGEADPAAGRPAGDAPAPPPAGRAADDADPDVLRKVRALLAKAESSGFEAEAEAFTAKAQALIATHSLADALRHGDPGDPTAGPDAARLPVERPYHREKYLLLGRVARANRCRAVLHDGLGFATVVGFPVDLEATELVFTSLLVQATRAMQRHGSTTDHRGRSTTRSFRRSFLEGFAVRIGERLAAETEKATARAAAAAEPDAPLLPVLVGRADAVERFVDEVFPRLSRLRTSRAAFDGAGYSAGVAAADRADLAARRPIAS